MAKSRTFDIIFRTKGTDKAQRDVGDIDNRISDLSVTAKQTATILSTALAAGTVAVGTKAVKTAGQFEMLRARLQGLTGSQKEANRLFDEFNQIAARTPFSVQEVIDAGATLQAFGLDAENLLTGIADLAAFMQVDIATAAQNFGRAMNAGAGAADMFRDKGINQLVASFAGVDNVTKLTLPEFQTALQKFIVDPSQPVAGATALMAETLVGKFSNAGDAVDRLAARFGDELLPTVKAATDIFINFVNSLDVQRVTSYAIGIGTLSTAFGVYRVATMSAVAATKAFRTALVTSGVGVAIVGLGELINALMEHKKNQEESVKTERNSFEAIQNKLVLQYEELNVLQEKLAQEQELDRLFFSQEKNIQRLIDQQKQKIAITVEDLQVEGQRLSKLQEIDQFMESVSEDIFDMPEIELFSDEDIEAIDGIIVKVDDAGKAYRKMSEEQTKLAKENREALLETAKAAALSADSAEDAMERVVRAAFMEAVAKQIAKIITKVPWPLNIGIAAGAGAAISGLFDGAVGMVKQLKFAQFGMDEMVSQPTLIMAGEAGPERVQVTPATRPSVNENQGGMTINFLGPITDRDFVRDTIIPEIEKTQRLGLA